jgi:hypothetical protein
MFLAIVYTNDLAKALIKRCQFEPNNIIVCSILSEIDKDERISNVQYCNDQDYEHYVKQCLMKKPELLLLEKFSDTSTYDWTLPRFYKRTRVVLLTNVYELPYIAFYTTICRNLSLRLKYDGICLNFNSKDINDIIDTPLLLETITSYIPSLKIISWISSLEIYEKIDMEITFSTKTFA